MSPRGTDTGGISSKNGGKTRGGGGVVRGGRVTGYLEVTEGSLMGGIRNHKRKEFGVGSGDWSS